MNAVRTKCSPPSTTGRSPPAPVRVLSFWFSVSRKPRDTERTCNASSTAGQTDTRHCVSRETFSYQSFVSLQFHFPLAGGGTVRRVTVEAVSLSSRGSPRQSTVYTHKQSTQLYMVCYVLCRLERGTVGRGSSLRGRVSPCVFVGQRSFQMVNSEQIWE